MNQFYPNSAEPRGRADAWFVNRRSEEAVNCICRRVKASQSQGAGAVGEGEAVTRETANTFTTHTNSSSSY